MMFLFDRHRRFRDQLSAYIDGALDVAAAGRLEAHLEECEGCRAELEQLRSTVAVLRELPEAQVPRSFALSPERAAAPRPLITATPLAFGARIAAAGVAAALAAVLVVDLGGLAGNGATEETFAPRMAAEREADDGKMDGEGAATDEATPTWATDELSGEEGGLTAEGDAGAGAEAPEPEDTAPRQPAATPAPTLGAAGEEAEDQVTRDSGVSETPAAEPEDAEVPAAAPSDGGGIDALTAAEIGLAAALGILLSGSLVLAFAGRKR